MAQWPKNLTARQKRAKLLQEGKAHVISSRCPKRGGPGDLSVLGVCSGCKHFEGLYFNGKVCTHDGAVQVQAEELQCAQEQKQGRLF